MTSCQNILHCMGVFDSGEAEVDAGMAVGQAFVIEAHQVQDPRSSERGNVSRLLLGCRRQSWLG